MAVGMEITLTLFGGGASFAVTLTGGAISNVQVLQGGAYYAGVPTLAAPGGTTNATLTAVLTNGSISSVTIVDGGAGYSSVPGITVTLASGASSVLNLYVDTDSFYSLEQYRLSLYGWSMVGGINTYGLLYPDVPSMLTGALLNNVVIPALNAFPTGVVASAQSTVNASTLAVQNLISGAVAAPIVEIQTGAASTAPGSNTLSFTLGSAAKLGDILIVCVSTASTSAAAAVSSISCPSVTFGKLYSRAVINTNWAGYNNLEVWIGVVVGGPSGTALTVNLSQNTDTYYSEVSVSEFSGVSRIAGHFVLDGAVVEFFSQSAQSTCTVGPYTNANPSDLVFAVLQADIAGPPTTPTGFTALTGDVHAGSWGLWPVYKVANTISTFSANWSGGFGSGATYTCTCILGLKGGGL